MVSEVSQLMVKPNDDVNGISRGNVGEETKQKGLKLIYFCFCT